MAVRGNKAGSGWLKQQPVIAQEGGGGVGIGGGEEAGHIKARPANKPSSSDGGKSSDTYITVDTCFFGSLTEHRSHVAKNYPLYGSIPEIQEHS